MTRTLIRQMRELGLRAGLAVNPDTPFEALEPYLADVDLVLCMTVFPGFGGQAFMPEVLDKVAAVRAAVDADRLDVRVEVDGGISPSTVADAARAGADVFVAGSAVFGSDDPAGAANELRRLASGAFRPASAAG